MNRKIMLWIVIGIASLILLTPLTSGQSANYYIPQWQNNNNYVSQSINTSYYMVVMPYSSDYIYVNIPTNDWLYMTDVNAIGGNMVMSIDNSTGQVMTFGFPNPIANNTSYFSTALEIVVYVNQGNTTVVINGMSYYANTTANILEFSGNGSFYYKSIYIYYPSSNFAIATDYAYVLFAFIFVFIFIAIVIALIKFSRGEE